MFLNFLYEEECCIFFQRLYTKIRHYKANTARKRPIRSTDKKRAIKVKISKYLEYQARNHKSDLNLWEKKHKILR